MTKAMLGSMQELRDQSAPFPLEDELASTLDYLMSKTVQQLKVRAKRMLDWAAHIEDWGVEKAAGFETHELQMDDMVRDLVRAKEIYEALAKVRAQRIGSVHSLDRAFSPLRMPTVQLQVTGVEEQMLSHFVRELASDEAAHGRWERKSGRGTLSGLDLDLDAAIKVRDHIKLSLLQATGLSAADRKTAKSLLDKLEGAI